MPDVVLKDEFGVKSTYPNVDTVLLKTPEGETTEYVSEHLIQNQIQADWNQTDSTSVDFIKNKPEIFEFVQSDWNQTDPTKPDYIKNKPETFETEDELPAVTIKDNGMVLGVIEGKWDKMELSNNGGSGQIGTIEIPTTISWSADPTPTITTDFNIGGTAYRMYKIADVTPTKAQLLSAHWSVSSPDGTTMFNKMLTSDEIGIDTTDMLQFRFTNDPTYAYAVCYTTGEITVDFAGIPITMNILETGLYQVMEAEYGLPNTLYGSCSYLVTEQVDFVQSNWEQNDAMQPDYVKNRPFYRGELKTEKWIVGIPLSFTLENLHEPYSYVGIPPEELLKLWYSDWE